ncbi:MAG TPA: CapA family protein [Kofleriaceae bacterium]
MRIAAVLILVACGGPSVRRAPVTMAPEPAKPAPLAAPDAPGVTPASTSPAPAPTVEPAPARAERIELTFMGDVMAGGTFSGRWVPQATEKHDPLEAISAQVASDLAVANLETPVVDKIPIETLVTDLRFGATPKQISWLPKHGITVVSLANNHAADLGAQGLSETPMHLAKLGITPIGAPRADGGPLVRVETIEVKGWKIGFIAATEKLNRGQVKKVGLVPRLLQKELKDALVPVVTEARTNHDLVFVVLHWGRQFADAPDRWQVQAAHAFIDAGADGVIAHHPHIWQRVERYKNGLIAYSLGNFVFQNSMPWQRLTGVLRLGFHRDKKCLDQVVIHPAAIYSSPVHHPKPVTGNLRKDIVERLTRLSGQGPNPTKLVLEGDRLVAPGACP